MENDSGLKLDFSTVIAYLLPGFIVEIIGFSLVDSLNIFFRSLHPDLSPMNNSLLSGLKSLGAGEGALLLTISLGAAYFIGLVLDICAHPPTLAFESKSKAGAYQKCYERLANLINNQQLREFLTSQPSVTGPESAANVEQTACEASEDATGTAAAALRAAEAARPTNVTSAQPAEVEEAMSAGIAAATTASPAARTSQRAVDAVGAAAKSTEVEENLAAFIDAVFYRTATSEAWARHNWSWSFYEAARQLTSLTKPVWVLPIAFYASLIFVRFFFPAYDRGPTFLVSAAASLLLVLLIWRYGHRMIKQYRGEICDFYHSYKANFVFGHLIQTGVIEHARVSLELSDKRN